MTELGPRAQSLLDIAKQDERPDPAARERVRLALQAAMVGAGVATTATAVSGAAAKGTLFATTFVKVVATVVVVGGVAAGVGYQRARSLSASLPRQQIETRAPAAETPHSILIPESDTLAVVPPAAASKVSRRQPRRAVEAGISPLRLQEEMQLLGQAQATLAQARPTQALQYLDDYARRFPKGTLLEEATLVRLRALCALGDAAGADQVAQDYLTRYPEGTYRVQIAETCVPRP